MLFFSNNRVSNKLDISSNTFKYLFDVSWNGKGARAKTLGRRVLEVRGRCKEFSIGV